ncbi:hypothetical protein HYX58_04040 [Candidatus Dependentiae bacterium]|nr:hypothetical protein [Candidatus Dependentiae bacterium]
MNKMKIIICLFLYNFASASYADFQGLQKFANKQTISRQANTPQPAALGIGIAEKFNEKALLNTVWQKDNPTTIDSYFRSYRERVTQKVNPQESFVRAIHANNQTVTKFVHKFLDKRTERIFDEIQQKDFGDKFNAPGELYSAVSKYCQEKKEKFCKEPGIIYSKLVKISLFKPLREKLEEIVSCDDDLKKMKIYVEVSNDFPNSSWIGYCDFRSRKDGVRLVFTPRCALMNTDKQIALLMHELGHAKKLHSFQYTWEIGGKTIPEADRLSLWRHQEYQADQHFASLNSKNAKSAQTDLRLVSQPEALLLTGIAAGIPSALFARGYIELSNKKDEDNVFKVIGLAGIISIPLIYKCMQFCLKKAVENDDKKRDQMTRVQYAEKFREFADKEEHAFAPYGYDNARRISELLKTEAKLFGAQSKLEELD